jgi:phosphoribosylamine-glycine ligase
MRWPRWPNLAPGGDQGRLAAGKGVTVAMTMAEAEAAVRDIFAGRFGEAGPKR